MKRKILSLALALCMVLVLLPTTALCTADETTNLTNAEMLARLPSQAPEVIKPENTNNGTIHYKGAMAETPIASNSDFTIENGILTSYKGNGGDVVIPKGDIYVEPEKPSWNFLFLIFPNNEIVYIDDEGKECFEDTSMSDKEIALIKRSAEIFQNDINEMSEGLVDVCVTVQVVDIPLAQDNLSYLFGSGYYLDVNNAYQLINASIDINLYDHITVFSDLNTIKTSYWGLGGTTFYQNTGYSFINMQNPDFALWVLNENYRWPSAVIVHEFLHFMETWSRVLDFDISISADDGGKLGYISESKNDYKKYYTDFINHNVLLKDGSTAGIPQEVWRRVPHLLNLITPSVFSIGERAFSGCKSLTSITIPDSVTSIGNDAFSECTSLTSLTIPDSVTSIGNSAFHNCTSLTEITIPYSVTNIGSGAFWGCTSLTNVVIPNGITSISSRAFSTCGRLTSVTIGNGVTSIGSYAFPFCTSLASVTIPDSVTNIGYNAFAYCPCLTDIYYGGSEAQWNAIGIDNGNSPLTHATIHYNSVGGFGDVKTDDYYANAVRWAVEQGITTGTSSTTFSPDVTCTQGQILTFLWRAKGEPAPAGAVSGDEYYATAAQWAAEQGLTDDFSAEADCTRAMVVTYLWKLAGSPKAASSSSFTDVPDTLADAVSWAAEQGIATGTSATTFSPDLICTRGQIVTFLYRDMAE